MVWLLAFDNLTKNNRKDLAGQVKNVFISEVDCTIEFQICQEKGIRGYPTLIFFQNGKQVGSIF